MPIHGNTAAQCAGGLSLCRSQRGLENSGMKFCGVVVEERLSPFSKGTPLDWVLDVGADHCPGYDHWRLV
ncbi:MAG: hypothetical protein AB2992_03055 [Candidatus Symbiodolus clandestinus]